MTQIKWHTISNPDELDSIIHNSYKKGQLIFKHSTRCGISSLIRSRLDKESLKSEHTYHIHLVNVIENRSLSHHLAETINVRHESPQLLWITSGKCAFHTSHFDITLKNIPTVEEQL